jgi:hypothetical protein
VPGTAAERSFAVPLCSVHKTKTIRNDAGEWYCPTCADSFLNEIVQSRLKTSIGGVDLPTGVRDERRVPSFRDVQPNRRARRWAKKRSR